MNSAAQYPKNGPTLAEVISEIRDEVKDFLQTRVQMFKSELREKVSAWRSGVILGAIAAVFGLTAFWLLTLALVGLIAVVFWGSAYAFFFAFLIVGFVWLAMAGTAAFLAVRELRRQGILPEKTIAVLKQDKNWLQQEARTQP
ncbi:MAG TPA: phage holin family protein [Terriglobales bacterium]|nr:phage holin family protein [Terriglobales bacterium]